MGTKSRRVRPRVGVGRRLLARLGFRLGGRPGMLLAAGPRRWRGGPKGGVASWAAVLLLLLPAWARSRGACWVGAVTRASFMGRVEVQANWAKVGRLE